MGCGFDPRVLRLAQDETRLMQLPLTQTSFFAQLNLCQHDAVKFPRPFRLSPLSLPLTDV